MLSVLKPRPIHTIRCSTSTLLSRPAFRFRRSPRSIQLGHQGVAAAGCFQASCASWTDCGFRGFSTGKGLRMAEGIPPRRLERPVIFVCDLQEKFAPAINEFDKVVLTTKKLLKMAQALSIPVLTTTQNAPRLGPIVPDLAALLPASSPPIDKTSFSMWVPELQALFARETSSSASHAPTAASSAAASAASAADQPCSIAIVGIESHICVTQTTLDLARAGHKVFVLADGVSSCNREEVPVALDRLRLEPGVTVTTSESWVYELMGDAGIKEFKAIAKIVKETGEDTKTALAGLLSKM